MRRVLLAVAAALALLLAAPLAPGSAQAAPVSDSVRVAAERLAETAAATPAEYAQYRRYGYRRGYYRPRYYGGYRRHYRPRFYGGPRFYGRPYGYGYRRW